MNPAAWPLALNILVFLTSTVVIAIVGSRLAAAADVIADRTGLGEAITGALLLGASTSLPGITASVTAAWTGHPELAVSNALGGIAAQTVFLAIADMTHRAANLEHAAASAPNIILAAALIALLAIILMAFAGPEVSALGIHPATPLLFLAYLFGLHIARQARQRPMWDARQTRDTRTDKPQAKSFEGPSNMALWTRFAVYALIIGLAGWMVARVGIGLAAQTGMSESLVGGLFTAVSTSLPELITSIAAVRQGALTLAVGNVLGGNAFDTLFVAVSDVAYRPGSIYHAASPREMFLCALTILLAATLVMGLVRRERRGIANIGFESFIVLVLYALGFLAMTFIH